MAPTFVLVVCSSGSSSGLGIPTMISQLRKSSPQQQDPFPHFEIGQHAKVLGKPPRCKLQEPGKARYIPALPTFAADPRCVLIAHGSFFYINRNIAAVKDAGFQIQVWTRV